MTSPITGGFVQENCSCSRCPSPSRAHHRSCCLGSPSAKGPTLLLLFQRCDYEVLSPKTPAAGRKTLTLTKTTHHHGLQGEPLHCPHGSVVCFTAKIIMENHGGTVSFPCPSQPRGESWRHCHSRTSTKANDGSFMKGLRRTGDLLV